MAGSSATERAYHSLEGERERTGEFIRVVGDETAGFGFCLNDAGVQKMYSQSNQERVKRVRGGGGVLCRLP